MFSDKYQNNVCLFACYVGVSMSGKKHDDTLWNDGNDLYLDSGAG